MEDKVMIDKKLLETLRNKAQKWDIINSCGITDHVKDVLDDLPSAQIECSCLQQFVIDSIDESREMKNDLPHVRFATKRLMNFINDIYYGKSELKGMYEL